MNTLPDLAGAAPARSLHITGSRQPRPAARRVAFCDGGIDASYREAQDVELSHWIPNRTPAAYKAATSTEICLRFAAGPEAAGIDLVVNNHVDTDGMLSVFALLHPELALAHAQTLVQAAAMGDFGAWGDADAQHLYQAVAITRQRLQAAQTDPLEVYRQTHTLVVRVLQGERLADAEPGIAALGAAVAQIESGAIVRRLLGPRLAHYVINHETADTQGWIPRLDEPLPVRSLLPPQARARFDAERLQLISVRHAGGWIHDVCYPGYAWAETVGLWRPPGLAAGASSNLQTLDYAPLRAAAAELAERETAPGRWSVAARLAPFETLAGRRFPVVLSLMDGERVVASALSPDEVAAVLRAMPLA